MNIKVKYVNGVFEPLEKVKDVISDQIYHVVSENELQGSRRKKRILLVDDEAAVTRTLKLYLDGTGRYEVRTENEGSQALATAQEFKPDLILLDIIMPDKDGSVLAAEIKDDPSLKDTPIVFLTALVSKKQTGDSVTDIGGHPFLAKPVDPDQVVACIENHAKN